jgi:RNA polymerase sigma-70 factor (ECF subfamily)
MSSACAQLRPLDPTRLGDHLDRLHRAAARLCGCPVEAEDLVQDTYLKVLRRPRLLRNDDDLGYLMCALRNTFNSVYRRDVRRPRNTPLHEHADVPELRHAAQPAEAAEVSELLAAVAGLDSPFREAVAAVDLAALSYREAARMLGTREGTIMSRLHRGRGQIADALGYTS